MKRFNKYIISIKFLYTISIISWFYFDFIAGDKFNDNIKYIIMLTCMLMVLMILSANNILKRYKNNEDFYNVKIIAKTGLILLIISYVFQIINLKFTIFPLKQFFYIIVPILFVYCYSKCFNTEKESDFYFNILFYAATITFFIKAYSTLTWSNIKQISFADSYSPFEVIGMSDIFLLIYCWYVKRKKYFFAIISAIICFLTFKRLHVVFMFLFLLAFLFDKKGKKVNYNRISLLAKWLFYLAPMFTLLMYSSSFLNFIEQYTSNSYNQLTMGRYRLVNLILDSYKNGMFINTGLGSTGEFLRAVSNGYIANMHCDVLRISIETTYIGYLIYTTNLFRIVKNRKYSVLVLIFMFVVMTLSHIMTSFIGWVIVYMFIFSEEELVDE